LGLKVVSNTLKATSTSGKILLGVGKISAEIFESAVGNLVQSALKGELLFDQPQWIQKIIYNSISSGVSKITCNK
jgi:hypothetical protein